TPRALHSFPTRRSSDLPTPLATISALAFLVRNRVRPLGMAKLGLPCQATGSGMAFPWDLIRNTPALGANLVEDLVMGLDMALARSEEHTSELQSREKLV